MPDFKKLNEIIDKSLSDLSDAIKAHEFEGYQNKTRVSWEGDKLMIHMTEEFALTGPLTVDAYEKNLQA